jgi:aminoglycoside phosphotransferase (APT) family kinase protein
VAFQLTAGSVAAYLRERGVVGSGPVSAEVLPGGVSNDVFAVTGEGVDLVVKQALPRLRVAAEWQADVRRILTEADALRIASSIRPDDVPAVVDVDDTAMTLTISRADRRLRNWKSDLLAGSADGRTGERLADALAAWHTSTAGQPLWQERFGTGAFVELRISPYHRWISELHPAVAARIDDLADGLLEHRLCLVHGDFSPKNVLADGARVSVLDWEVAHYGDPVFDVAFLQTHLLLKAVHRPESSRAYRELADTFLRRYDAAVPDSLRRPDDYLAGQVGCLMLARVDGKSPAEYLTGVEALRVRGIALDTLCGSGDVAAIWQAVDG